MYGIWSYTSLIYLGINMYKYTCNMALQHSFLRSMANIFVLGLSRVPSCTTDWLQQMSDNNPLFFTMYHTCLRAQPLRWLSSFLYDDKANLMHNLSYLLMRGRFYKCEFMTEIRSVWALMLWVTIHYGIMVHVLSISVNIFF